MGKRQSLEERFWPKVQVKGPDECWEWTAATAGDGYGTFRSHNRMEGAHRVAYELIVGSIPQGLEIDHLCRNPICVNPQHLEPVTHKVNLLRGVGVMAQNSRKTHCVRGHPYDTINTRIGTKGRSCRACHRIWDRVRRPRG